MNRRIFAKNIGAGALFLGIGGIDFVEAANNPNLKHITILHTNDTHSHIEPLPVDAVRYPNQGGVARRATLINIIRQENPNTLLFDAGDIFQGTPYFNYYGGELEFRLMSMLKYDAATLGNHDFDNGLDGLNVQLPYAKFDFICSNYDFKNTILDGKTKPYKIFEVDGIRVGVFGLGVEFEGLVSKNLYLESKYLDPIEISRDMEKVLRHEKKCDLVICLSHLGYKYSNRKVSDLVVAQNSSEIDLIIGGHTHTFLDKPTIINNRKGREILVNQVGCYGINLGRIDFFFDAARKIHHTKNASINVG